MQRVLSNLFIFLLLIPLSASSQKEVPKREDIDTTAKERNTLFIVDISGSMDDELRKIKPAIARIVSKFPPDQAAGLLTFAGCTSNDIHYLIPIARGTHKAITSAVNGLRAYGGTDIAGALKTAREIQAKFGECIKMILFTDDIDSCGGNVRAALQGINSDCLQISIVTTITEEEDKFEFLKNITEMTGGVVITAHSQQEKLAAIKKLLQRKQGSGAPTTIKTDKKDKKDEGTPTEKKEEKKKEKDAPKKADKTDSLSDDFESDERSEEEPW